MIRNYFTFDIDSRAILMAEGDTYCFGKHTFAYVMARWCTGRRSWSALTPRPARSFPPMPSARSARSAATSMPTSMTLRHDWLPDARRYYTNIVGKYGHAGAGAAQEGRYA